MRTPEAQALDKIAKALVDLSREATRTRKALELLTNEYVLKKIKDEENTND